MSSETYAVELAEFSQACEENTGINCSELKHGFLRRRFRRVLRTFGAANWRELSEQLQAEPYNWMKVEYLLSVHVSEFNRHPEQYEWIREVYVPRLAERIPRITALVYGCSQGEELWSLVIALRESEGEAEFSFTATDHAMICLNRTRRGLYPAEELESVDEELRRRYFERKGSGWEVRDSLRRDVEIISSQGLNPEDRRFDIVFARNWLIYLNPDAIERWTEELFGLLKSAGLLVVAPTEERLISGAAGLRPVTEAPRGILVRSD